MNNAYDTVEALALLHGFAEEIDPDLAARRKAGEKLLDELVALDGKSRVRVQKNADGHVVLGLFRRNAAVLVDRDGNVLVGSLPFMRDAKEVPLQFNPATQSLESKKDDGYRLPEPGKPRAKRSALAEVVEIALGFVRPPV